MSLLPDNDSHLLDNFLSAENAGELVYPSKTYKINFNSGRVGGGMIDDIDAVRQFITKTILTNRSHYRMYSDDYGCELIQLIGNSATDALIHSEIPRMIRESLIYDDRINNVSNIAITKNLDSVSISFDVDSIYGNFETEVSI